MSNYGNLDYRIGCFVKRNCDFDYMYRNVYKYSNEDLFLVLKFNNDKSRVTLRHLKTNIVDTFDSWKFDNVKRNKII